MKKIIYLIVFIFAAQAVNAQLFKKDKVEKDGNAGKGNIDNRRLSWGYYIGVNTLDFDFDYLEDERDIQVIKKFGFNIGLMGNLKINEYLDVRTEPGLVINSRELNFSQTNFIDVDDVSPSDFIRNVESTYIYLPLTLKFSTKRLNNFKPFVLGGASAIFNLSSNQDNLDDNSTGQFRTINTLLSYELGFGIDFYLEWFKFTPSIRGVFGIGDELVRDRDPNSPWTGNIASMKTRGVFIMITVQ